MWVNIFRKVLISLWLKLNLQGSWQIYIPILFILGSESQINDAPNILKGRQAEDNPNVKIYCPSALNPKVPIFPCFEYNTKYSK